MKKKIEEALSAEYKGLGLSDKTIGRLADYIVSKGSVTKEDDIAAAVKGDDVKLLATSIQGEIAGLKRAKETAETALADYKAKHPEDSDDPDGKKDPKKDPDSKQDPQDLAKTIADAVAAAVNPVKEAFEAYKAQNSAKEAVAAAKAAFYENKWTTKFKEEADDAWDRAHELNEAKGGGMSTEELKAKATEYFNKAVQRKGTDATKPFEASEQQDGNFDFSTQAKHFREKGMLPPEEKQ